MDEYKGNNYEYTFNDSAYTFNNEAIGMVAIASVLNYMQRVSISKAMLILPLALHEPTINYLKLKSVKVKSLEQLIADKYHLLTNFNKRYKSLMPISLNSLFLLEEMEIISMKGGIISLEKEINFDDSRLGKRGKNVNKSALNIKNILDDDVEYLYLQLRVEL
ncbi:DUF6521 family protein [Halobacillus sp. A1]|uniref:three component ABC system middle component n=1 Tax=Halobacillus sp. A1 TaxID=2880262 RepID=UPI0020A62478|nr:three component ABC system middle component [Halobacillus sp. A1]MCP3032656.1 DUF6521 family protein [Halobacillus sp. A1]